MGKEMSRRRNDRAPTWSSWPWVSRHPSSRSAFSRSQVKSGRTRSTPSMSTSGNMSPQSSSSSRPSCSKHAQLRPISPSPPRNVIRIWSATPKVGEDLAGPVLEALGGGPEGQPALAHRQPQHPHHGLGRDGIRGDVAALVLPRLEQQSVDRAGPSRVTLLEGGDHLAYLEPSPVAGDADDSDRP